MWNLTYLQQTPPELRNLASFTKANIRGRWINTVASPGWYARGRYGREVLKHSQSWIKLGLKSSWVEYKPGTFKPCNKPKHHSCLSLSHKTCHHGSISVAKTIYQRLCWSLRAAYLHEVKPKPQFYASSEPQGFSAREFT